jgi:hypothetical protein
MHRAAMLQVEDATWRTAGPAAAGGSAAPLPPSAIDLMSRSDAELVAAQLSGEPDERFLHAHLAALRAGAALLAVTGRPSRRPAPRTVWEMVVLVAPELSEWTSFFADAAATRSAIEAGRDGHVDDRRAEVALAAAEDFQEAVRARLAGQSTGSDVQLPQQRRLALRAS